MKRDVSLRGWNWGVADFVGEYTEFENTTHRSNMIIHVRHSWLVSPKLS